MSEKESPEEEVSFNAFFVPVTSLKAICWIIIIGLLVYFNSLFNGFVYDDYTQIINNPLVHSFTYFNYFFTGGTFFDAGSGQIIGLYYKPLLTTIFALLYTFFGPLPFPYHFFQLTLHITNAILIFFLFRRFFKKNIAIYLALVFLLHPINEEAVVYIANLQETLFLFFGMLALTIASHKIKSFKKIILINIFLLLGLFSKETAILFVPILVLQSYLFLKENLSKLYIGTILFTTALYLYLYFFVAHLAKVTNAVLPIMKASLQERLINIPAIIFYYITTFFYPNKLALAQEWIVKNVDVSHFYIPLLFDTLFFLVLIFLGVYIFKKNKQLFSTYIFFFVWLILGLLMHMQIIPLDATVADRWFYFPIIGLLGLFGTAFSLFNPRKNLKKIIITVGLIVLIMLSIRTIIRNTNWSDTLTLCQHDLAIEPESYSLQEACGEELLSVGKFEESKKYFAAVVKIVPLWGPSWYQYGLSYEYTGHIKKAREDYRKSIQLSNEVQAYVTLAATYLKYDNNPQKALKVIKEGIKNYPNYQPLQLFMAVIEYRLHNQQDALKIATQAYQTSPSSEALYVLHQISNNEEVNLGK